MPLGQSERDNAPERVPEHVGGLVEQAGEDVGEPGEGRGGKRRGAAVARQVGDDEPPPGEEGRERLEVPGGPAVAVDQEERRALPAALEDADPRPAALVEAAIEPVEQVRRIRHPDLLFYVNYEFDRHKAGRVKIPVLLPQGAGDLAR